MRLLIVVTNADLAGAPIHVLHLLPRLFVSSSTSF
jgi:hypothetical protein